MESDLRSQGSSGDKSGVNYSFPDRNAAPAPSPWPRILTAVVLLALGGVIVWSQLRGRSEVRAIASPSAVREGATDRPSVIADLAEISRRLSAGTWEPTRPEPDAAALSDWFTSRGVGFDATLPDLAAERFDVVGGAVRSLDGRSAAAVVYQAEDGTRLLAQLWRGDDSTLPDDAAVQVADGRTIRSFQRDGVGVAVWRTGDLMIALAGDLPVDRLVAMAAAR